MSGPRVGASVRSMGGVELAHVLPLLRRLEPDARACWVYDLDRLGERAERLTRAFRPLAPRIAYALKANALPAITSRLATLGLHADAGSLGELEAARAAGFSARSTTLSGNGRTPEEAAWVAAHGVSTVSADSVAELDLLEAAMGRVGSSARIALRINPGIMTATHAHVSTGHAASKFGMSPSDALDAWAARSRWPHLVVDGVHAHIGSQLLDRAPLIEAARGLLSLADASAARGAPLALINLGGGFGHDHEHVAAAGFDVEAHARELTELAAARSFEWGIEPGRWLVAPIGIVLAEVLSVKTRRDADGERRFIVLAAGMNDLLRPALYGALHRIEPIEPRVGARSSAIVVGPVCESGDTFIADASLPPIEVGDLVAIQDAGAYGAGMSSNYNGRGRLAELVAEGGSLRRARRGETPDDLRARDRDDPLG